MVGLVLGKGRFLMERRRSGSMWRSLSSQLVRLAYT